MNKSGDNKPNWLTIGQAAKYLGVSRDTLRRWEKAGKIKAVRSPTNRRYYTQKQLDEIMGKKRGGIKTKKSQRKSAGTNPWKLIVISLLSLIAAAILGFLLLKF